MEHEECDHWSQGCLGLFHSGLSARDERLASANLAIGKTVRDMLRRAGEDARIDAFSARTELCTGGW